MQTLWKTFDRRIGGDRRLGRENADDTAQPAKRSAYRDFLEHALEHARQRFDEATRADPSGREISTLRARQELLEADLELSNAR